MSQLILPNNHYILSVTTDIAEICLPLFQSTPINHFCFIRVYKNDKAYFLVSNGELAKNHVNIKGYPIAPNVDAKFIDKKFYYLAIPNNLQFDQAVYDFKNLFNVHYPIYLFEKYDSYFDGYFFGSKHNDPSTINFYFNNMQFLENFKFYFKDKANRIIKNTEKNIIFIPESMRSNIISEKNPSIKSITTEFNPVLYQFNNFSISKREMETIQNLCHGDTLKEAAKKMGISPRTAEQYLNNVKEKLGVNRKSQVINFMAKNLSE